MIIKERLRMAELILTAAEKAAHSWLDLDDAALGRIVKAKALNFLEKAKDGEQVYTVIAAMLLADYVQQEEANRMDLTFDMTSPTQPDGGEWCVSVVRVGSAESAESADADYVPRV